MPKIANQGGDAVTIVTDVGTVDHAGEVINYDIEVTNVGSSPLLGVQVLDSIGDVNSVLNLTSGDTNGNGILDPGETWVYATKYTVTLADFLAGTPILNNATVLATDANGGSFNSGFGISTDIDRVSSIDVEKLISKDGGHNWYLSQSPGDSFDSVSYIAATTGIAAAQLHVGTPTAAPGAPIEYLYVVQNTGNVDLSDVTLTDTSVALGAQGALGDLPGGATRLVSVNTTAVAGPLNSGVAQATDVSGVTDSDAGAYRGVAAPDFIITNVASTSPANAANAGEIDHAGQIISYDVQINNDGDQSFTSLVVSGLAGLKPVLGPDGVHNVGDLNHDGVFGPNETWQFTASQTVTQPALDSGAPIVGSVTATASNGGVTAGPQTASATTSIEQAPALDLVNLISVDNGANWWFQPGTDKQDTIALLSALTGIAAAHLHVGVPVTNAGSPIEVELVATNSGNVDLTGVSLTDSSFPLGALGSLGAMAPGSTKLVTLHETAASGLPNTDNAQISAMFDGAAVSHAHGAQYNGIDASGFQEGVPALPASYWAAHPDAWAPYLVNQNGVTGLLIGDPTGNLNLLDFYSFLIPASALPQLLNPGGGSDMRQLMVRQAIAAQLNIDHGVHDPNLIVTVAQWLQGLAPFAPAGNIDTNLDTIINAGAGPGFEYDTKTHQFTSPKIAANDAAWTNQVLFFAPDYQGPAELGAFSANGQGLLSALEAFNSNHLVTNATGYLAAWDASGSPTGPFTDVSLDNGYDFWRVLHDNLHHTVGLTGIL